MKISENFTLEELTVTNTGLDNVPNAEALKNLKQLVEKVLQPLRTLYGKPITVTSGYRSLRVNAKVGGARTSQHIKGEAADIKCADNTELFNLIKNNFDFDQLIWEKGNHLCPDWVHVSYRKYGNRNQILYIK